MDEIKFRLQETEGGEETPTAPQGAEEANKEESENADEKDKDSEEGDSDDGRSKTE